MTVYIITHVFVECPFMPYLEIHSSAHISVIQNLNLYKLICKP